MSLTSRVTPSGACASADSTRRVRWWRAGGRCPARRDRPSFRLGRLRHPFEGGGALAPGPGKRAPAGDLAVDRLEVLRLEAALDARAGDAGVEQQAKQAALQLCGKHPVYSE